MTAVTITTQLSTFALIRDIILTSSSLTTKFTKNDFYEFEPNLKSPGVKLPHFVLRLPRTETDTLVIDQSTTIKEFTVDILLKMDYSARDKAVTYSNALIRAIESSESTFQSSGYYMPVIEVVKIDDEIEDQKQLIVGQFELKLTGNVLR